MKLQREKSITKLNTDPLLVQRFSFRDFDALVEKIEDNDEYAGINLVFEILNDSGCD